MASAVRVGLTVAMVGALMGPIAADRPVDDSARAERVFAEPSESPPPLRREAFITGMTELEARYPDLIHYSTVAEELGGALGSEAFSAGGNDFQVITMTDPTVPDQGKGYLLMTVAHGGEWCGLEAIPRVLEDLAIAKTEAPDTLVDAGTGPDGERLTMTVEQLLREVKIIFVEISPDGWMAGQQNANGANTNRMASTIGWTLPMDQTINDYGYGTLEQPAGGAITTWLESIRRDELGGRPFATAMDFHGPIPSGFLLIDTTAGSIGAASRKLDLAERMTERSLEVLFGSEAAPLVAGPYNDVIDQAERARRLAEQAYQEVAGESEINKILYAGVRWSEHATAWESLDYDVPNHWGRYMGSPHSLGADSFSHEIPCQVQLGRDGVAPDEMQLYVDNVRAIVDVLLVHSATRFDAAAQTFDFGGSVGWVDAPFRVTDADGNPVPPPSGYPGTIFHPTIEQRPYDVSQTDWFRDVTPLATSPIVPLPSGAADFADLDTVVVADHTDVDVEALRAFAEAGGNVVLTDSALVLAPAVAGLAGQPQVVQHRAYVGYTDLDRNHPWTDGLYEAARQTFDSIALGYPLLLERDQYWIACFVCTDGSGPLTETENSAPIWTIDRVSWVSGGGTVVGTADPADDPKGTHDGVEVDKVNVGTIPVGQGRLVVLGAVLPTPTEEFDHWFGLAPYAMTPLGEHLLTTAITWERPA